MKYLKVLILLLGVILLISCRGNDEGTAMKIKWPIPTNWSSYDAGQDDNGTYEYAKYYFQDDSSLYFQAEQFPSKHQMNKSKEEIIAVFRDGMLNTDKTYYVEKSNDYEVGICGQDTIVFELAFHPNETPNAAYEVYSIDIWFSLDKTFYNISLASNEIFEDISDARIAQFWNMIENIECPNE